MNLFDKYNCILFKMSRTPVTLAMRGSRVILVQI